VTREKPLPRTPHPEIVPLGGVGEFGLNMMVYRHGGDCLVVDAGMMFPAGNLPGVDYVVPVLDFLAEAGRLRGVVLTHGHEDHIGALAHLLSRFDAPVWGTDYTLELVRRRLVQRGFEGSADLRRLPDSPAAVEIGPFSVEAITVAHSIPQCRLLAIRTPAGLVVHSGDFKLDTNPPDGDGTDLARLAELGDEGVLALLADSTNAGRETETPSESAVEPGLDEILREATGRVLLTTFASNIQRLALLGRLAARHGRRLALLGASVSQHADIAQQLGLITFPAGTRIAAEDLAGLPRSVQLAVAGGSQGEALSAMTRIATAKHRDFHLEPGDTVIHSARVIPGNEKPIGHLINRLLRLGARVVTADDAPVHVSGHGSAEELGRLIQTLRPRWYVPVHGEYSQLKANAGLAVRSGLGPERVLLVENGDRIAITVDGLRVVGQAPVGRMYLEGPGDEVTPDHVRERRKSGHDGVVVAVVEIDPQTGAPRGYPDVVARGFTPALDAGGEMLERSREAITQAIDEAPAEERRDSEALAARIETHLRRCIRRTANRQPLVIARVRL
jgi:ribonuclease J